METKEIEKIYAELLDGYAKAQQEEPALSVDDFIKRRLAADGANHLEAKVQESLDFIEETARNTAQVIEDTKKMRLDTWIRKNIFELFKGKDRKEFEKGFNEAANQITQQSFNEIEEEGK